MIWDIEKQKEEIDALCSFLCSVNKITQGERDDGLEELHIDK